MNLAYTGRIRRMDDLNRIAIPKQICETLGYEAGAPFEFYVDNEEGAVIIRPYKPNSEAMRHGDSNDAAVWVNAQIEAFAAFGHILEVITLEGKRIGSYDYDIPTPSEVTFKKAFKTWEEYGVPSFYRITSETLQLYPIVNDGKPFLWIMSTAPDVVIMSLADAYMDKFVY